MCNRMLKLFLRLVAIQESVTSEPGHWSGGIPGSCPVPPQAAELHCSTGGKDRITHDQLQINHNYIQVQQIHNSDTKFAS